MNGRGDTNSFNFLILFWNGTWIKSGFEKKYYLGLSEPVHIVIMMTLP